MSWLLGAWARVRGALLALAAVVVAIAGAWLYGRRQGKQAQRATDEAAQAKATLQTQQQTIHAHEVRDEVEAEVSKLPDAPPQKVADAAPGTASGQLRDSGWLRD